jgi:hypothetical protein
MTFIRIVIPREGSGLIYLRIITEPHRHDAGFGSPMTALEDGAMA